MKKTMTKKEQIKRTKTIIEKMIDLLEEVLAGQYIIVEKLADIRVIECGDASAQQKYATKEVPTPKKKKAAK